MMASPASVGMFRLASAANFAFALGHALMGRTELAPSIKALDKKHTANTALTGWYQGCWLYYFLGLLDLRLSTIPHFGYFEALLLGGQISFHAFSALNLPTQLEKHLSPKTLMGFMTALVTAATGIRVLNG